MTTPAPSALPSDMAAQLAQLRDIHLPGAVSWWPLAPGWWVLAIVLTVCILAALGFEIRRRRSLKYRALRELEQLKSGKSSQVTILELASELCVLIRRVVLNTADGRIYASTHGDAWSGYLAASPHGMPDNIARFIATAPYTFDDVQHQSIGEPAPKMDVLISAVENWIRRHT